MPLLDPLSSIWQTLKKDGIIPDVIKDESFTPSTLFSVSYGGREIVQGEELYRSSTLLEPEIVLTPMVIPDPNAGNQLSGGDHALQARYTLVMTDPDAPSRNEPKYKQFRHWVITGLQLPQSAASTPIAIKTNQATTPYRPPGPPPGSGLHRYTFLLFLEPPSTIERGPFKIPEGAVEYSAELEQRRNWDAAKFGETYGLQLVGVSWFFVAGE